MMVVVTTPVMTVSMRHPPQGSLSLSLSLSVSVSRSLSVLSLSAVSLRDWCLPCASSILFVASLLKYSQGLRSMWSANPLRKKIESCDGLHRRSQSRVLLLLVIYV